MALSAVMFETEQMYSESGFSIRGQIISNLSYANDIEAKRYSELTPNLFELSFPRQKRKK